MWKIRNQRFHWKTVFYWRLLTHQKNSQVHLFRSEIKTFFDICRRYFLHTLQCRNAYVPGDSGNKRIKEFKVYNLGDIIVCLVYTLKKNFKWNHWYLVHYIIWYIGFLPHPTSPFLNGCLLFLPNKLVVFNCLSQATSGGSTSEGRWSLFLYNFHKAACILMVSFYMFLCIHCFLYSSWACLNWGQVQF